MKSVAVLLVAWLLTCPLAVLPAFAGSDEKALQRAMEQQRKAAEAEMRRQADYEKKLVEQQNRAMQARKNVERKMVEAQQKALQNQQKVNQAQHATAVVNHSAGHAGSGTQSPQAHITTTQTTTPVYHAARPYYGHSHGHAYHRTVYHNYRTMPTHQLDPQSRALLKLKTSLDHVRMGSPVTPAETTAIKRALMGAVNVPKVPTLAALQSLSNRLADGLSNRGSSSAQTGPMALTLMGALNSTELANIDLTEIMNEHRSALKNSKVRPTEITPIMESLKIVANQERSRR